jgi:hypothetical protein
MEQKHVLTNQLLSLKKFTWPPSSPNLTPLVSFMWVYVRNIVHAENFRDFDHVWQRTIAAVATVTPDMHHHIWTETDSHLDVCAVTNDAHI